MLVFRAIFLISASLLFTSCDRFRDTSGQRIEHANAQPNSTSQLPSSVHLAFGNPSNAANEPDNFMIVGEGSVLSYNDSRGSSNWVSWRTTRADLGNSIPRPDFRPDLRLPRGFRSIGYYDYSGSSYDRGHLVPSADRFGNAKLNEETFMMTNIVPQTGALNQYPWEKLESYVRSQVWSRKFDAYQIAGGYGELGFLKNKVAVPTNCWKIVALVPRGRSADSIDQRTRVIAVDMPNIRGIENEPWEKYKTSIRKIEERTGLDFFAAMSRELQDLIETRTEIKNPG